MERPHQMRLARRVKKEGEGRDAYVPPLNCDRSRLPFVIGTLESNLVKNEYPHS